MNHIFDLGCMDDFSKVVRVNARMGALMSDVDSTDTEYTIRFTLDEQTITVSPTIITVPGVTDELTLRYWYMAFKSESGLVVVDDASSIDIAMNFYRVLRKCGYMGISTITHPFVNASKLAVHIPTAIDELMDDSIFLPYMPKALTTCSDTYVIDKFMRVDHTDMV